MDLQYICLYPHHNTIPFYILYCKASIKSNQINPPLVKYTILSFSKYLQYSYYTILYCSRTRCAQGHRMRQTPQQTWQLNSNFIGKNNEEHGVLLQGQLHE